MNITAIIIIGAVALLVLYKLYGADKRIRKDGINGIKGMLTKKLIMLGVVAVGVGIFVLIYPDVELHSPHHFVIEYISKAVEN